MFPLTLDALGLRPLRTADTAELHALVEAHRDHLARWMPRAAGQDLSYSSASASARKPS